MIRTNKGFTLIEVLLITTIASIIGISLISTLVQSNRLYSQQSVKVSQGLNINDASSQISDIIRSSAGVTASYSTYTSSSTTLIVKLPSYDSSSNTIDNLFDYAVITIDPVKPMILKKLVIPNPQSKRLSENKVLASNLSKLQFYYYDNNGLIVAPIAASKINYVINLSQKAGTGSQQSSASGQVSLRND